MSYVQKAACRIGQLLVPASFTLYNRLGWLWQYVNALLEELKEPHLNYNIMNYLEFVWSFDTRRYRYQLFRRGAPKACGC